MKWIYEKRAILLGCILLLSSLIRLPGLESLPPSLSWDEVSIGYNAYSILKTAKDEHGKFLPVDTFVAYGDYKPPLSVYLTTPFIALFGLTEQAVRLPSAISGILFVGLVYMLVQELFVHEKEDKQSRMIRCVVGLVAALVVAISPWHILLSRAGFEANIAATFLISGALFILKSRKHAWFFMAGTVMFVASLYTFNSARYAAPILAVLCIWFIRIKKGDIRTCLVAGVVACILLAPITPHLLSKEARLRFQEVNIFTDSRIVETANSRIEYAGSTIASKILNNRRVGYFTSYLTHFFDHIEPWFLFVRGDGNPKFSIQDVGQLYLIEAPFLIFGLYMLWRYSPRVGMLSVLWVVASIIPAATARETPHALRIENSLPMWQLWVAFGVVQSILVIKNKLFQKVFIASIVILYLGNAGYFFHTYVQHYPREFSGEWQYGYREAIRYVSPLQSQYDRIFISESIGRAYMYTLFYERTDPTEYRSSTSSFFDAAGFYHVDGFGKYVFVRDAHIESQGNNLYVYPPKDVPANARVLETVRLLNGTPVLVVFDQI